MAIDKYKPQLPLPDLTASYPSFSRAAEFNNQVVTKGVTGLLGIASDALIDYEEEVKKANTLETDAMLTKMFTERNVNVQANVKLGDTVGLVDREYAWTREELEKVRKASKLSDKDFNTLYNSHTSDYLKKIGTYQLAEGKRYQEQAMDTWSKTMKDNMATVPVGDLRALSTFMDNARQVYKNDPVKGREEITDAFKTQMQMWSYQNPKQALAWFEQNRGQLAGVFGSDIIEAEKVFNTAEENMRAEVRFGIAMEKHAMDRAEFMKKQYNEQTMNNFYSKVFTPDGSPGNWSEADVHAIMDDPNVTFANKKLAGGIIASVTNPTTETPYNNAYTNQTLLNIWSGNFNLQRYYQDVAAGRYTPAQMSRIESANANFTKVSEDPQVKASLNTVFTLIDKTYGTNNGLIAANPQMVAQMKQQVAADILTMPVEKRIQALNLNDQNSYINQLLTGNMPTKIQDDIRKQMSGGQFVYSPIAVPGADNVGAIAAPTVVQETTKPVRMPGEDISSYTKRLRAWRDSQGGN